MDKSEKTILLIVFAVVAGCLLAAVLCALTFRLSEELIPTVPTPAMPTAPVCTVPVLDSKELMNVDSSTLSAAVETQTILEQSVIPTANLNKVAEWMTGQKNLPIYSQTPAPQYQIGDQLSFYKQNEDNENVPTIATLRYATNTVYFWAENEIVLDAGELQTLVDIFSNSIYPTDQAFFGSEWIPGVDNDPHLYILYARGLGGSIAGYTSSVDYVLPEVYQYSNAHEMFFINADAQGLNDLYTLSTMAHEMQHVIQGYRDPNEELWLNEGFSELATLINGYQAGGFDYWFTLQPDMQLNDWSADPNQNDINYGASYLFTTYLYGRFGETITKAVAGDPLNGFASIDNVFKTNNLIDPVTGSLITADEFFRDWTITNFLNDPNWVDGRYYYSKYPSVPAVEDAEWLNECQGTTQSAIVHQYGTDYFQIGCNNLVRLDFAGIPVVQILPDEGENASYLMWSNRAETSDMTLSKSFDLTAASSAVTLTFDAWFDLEVDFDFVYLLASVDGGEWQMLNVDSCSNYYSLEQKYDCGFNGNSLGWQNYRIDLTPFSGHLVTLQFELVTDGAVNNEGFGIDNLQIPEIGYSENFEESDGGWFIEGFSRIHNVVPQSFLVSLVTSDPQNPIKKYQVNAGEELSLTIDPHCLEFEPILIVSGTSRFTRQQAEYTITLTE